MKNINSIIGIIFSVALLCLSACSEPDYPTATPTVTTLTSKVTVFNAMAGGPRVQLKIDNVATPKDTLRYEPKNGKFYNSVTLTVPAGPTRLIASSNLEDGSALATDRNPIVSGTSYSYFLINRITKVNGVDTPTPAIRRVIDDLSVPDVGSAKVRFLHFALGVGEIKVTNTDDASITYFSARKYDEVSRVISPTSTLDFAKFTTVAAGTYNYDVKLTSDNTVLLSIASLKLDSKGVYTIYLRGLAAGSDDTALNYTVFKH